MADVRVVIDRAALAELLTGPNGAVAKEITRRTIRVHNRAKQLCPVDTGRLRSSISWRIDRVGGQAVGVVGTNVNYAPFVELGTRRMSARPFLRPALDAARSSR